MKNLPLFLHKKTPYQRLTVHLFNAEHKKDFVNTYTYYDVENEKEAIRVIWDMHSLITDNAHDMSRKIIKVTYQGKPLLAFKPEDEHTRNGWIVKENS